MNTKKMLAILAALSMLGTTGLTVGAEDTAATEPAVETVVTTEAEAETAVSEIAETRTETTAADEAKMEVNETTVTEETAITTTIVQSEEPTSTTTAVKSDADGVETTVAVTGTESASVTTTTTYSAEETSKIMEELQKQIDNLIDEIQSGSNPDLLPDEENVEMLPDYSSDNILQLEDGTWIGTYHTYYVDEEGYTYQVVYYVKTDGTKDIFYVTYYDDFDHNDALVCSDNPFYDEFYVQFTTFYKTLENTK